MQPPNQSTPVSRPGCPPQAQVQTQNLASVSVPTASVIPTNQLAPASSSDTAAPPDAQLRRRSKKRRVDNEDGGEPPLLPVPLRPPTVHPLSKGPYNTMEDAIFALQLFVFTSGYGVSQKRTVKEKLPSGKYDPGGDIIRKDFACDKGGNEFVSQSRGERRRESKKCGCPWKAAIRRLRREGDRWFIEILDAHHNHPVTSQDQMHTLASYRRWQRENNAGIRNAISRLTRAAAMPARDIAAYLKGDLQDPELDRIDKQILRALSMNDKEGPGSEKEEGSIVFEMVARRPVIILQDNQSPPTTSASSYPTASNPNLNPQPNTHANATPAVGGFSNSTTPSGPFEDSAAYHTFANTFASSTHAHSNPQTATMAGTTANVPSDYGVVP